MKIRIVSDGLDTRVIHASTGEPIEGVFKVEWISEIGSIPFGVVYVYADADVEVVQDQIELMRVDPRESDDGG